MSAPKKKKKADIDHLHDCVEAVKAEVASVKAAVGTIGQDLARNTEITTQVRDVLATFKVMLVVSKWIAAAGAAVAGVAAAVKGIRS